MASQLRLDRLLETCYRRGATDILIIPGVAPLLRLADAWRALQTPAVGLEEIEYLTSEALGTKPTRESDGSTHFDFSFGSIGRFRARAFGLPSTKLLLITRYPDEREKVGVAVL